MLLIAPPLDPLVGRYYSTLSSRPSGVSPSPPPPPARAGSPGFQVGGDREGPPADPPGCEHQPPGPVTALRHLPAVEGPESGRVPDVKRSAPGDAVRGDTGRTQTVSEQQTSPHCT